MKLTFFGDVYLADDEKLFNIDVKKYVPYIFNFEYAYYAKENPHALQKALLKSAVDIEQVFNPLPYAVDVNNNHILDYGEEGLASTLEYLDKKEIKYFGSGSDEDNQNNPLISCFEDKKVAFLGYYNRERDQGEQKGTLKLTLFSENRFIEDVKRCRALGADIIIPSIHWGIEHSPGFSKKQQNAAHFMIDNGADIVIGHHPHCIQPWEKYKDKYIFYSLGNLAFHDIYTKSWYTDENHSACMHCKRWHKWSRESLGVTYDLDSGNVELHKMYQKNHTVKELDIPQDKLWDMYKAGNVKHIKQKTLIRKSILAVSCFFFFHGHIFYWKGFWETLKLFIDMHIRSKNWDYPE